MKAKQKARTAGLPIETLARDPDNAREIGAEEARGLRSSLDDFGDLSGLVWNRRNGKLVAGHQRLDQLIAAGVKTWKQTGPDAGQIVHPTTGAIFHVRIVEWDDETHRLAQFAANNPETQGRFSSAAGVQLAALRSSQPVAFGALRLGALLAALDKAPRLPDASRPTDGDGASKLGAGSVYSVIVDFDNEESQRTLLEELEGRRGLTCRLLIA